MKSFRLHWLAAFVLLLLVSCSKSNKQGRLIPKDAAMVLHINGESVNSKLPWDEIKSNPVFQKMYADSSLPQSMKQVLDNPDNSGIDIKTDLSFFMVKDSIGGYIGITGTVKDAAKFKAFNLESSKGSVTENNGNSYISKAPVCVGWNKDKFVYVVDAPQIAKTTSFGNINGNDETKSRDLGATCRSVFDLKESNSLAKDEKFSTLMGNKGDAHFWMNTEKFYSGMSSMAGPMAMLKLDKLYEGSYTTATVNFENGKIDLDYKGYVGKALKDVVKKYSGGNLDENMLKRIPAKDVAVAFAFHFKPEGIKELLKAMELEPLINMGLAFAGFSMDDFIKANKGDLMFALTDFKMKTDSISMHGLDGKMSPLVVNKPEPEYIFSVAVNDKEAFGKLIQAAKKAIPGGDAGDNKIAYNTSNGYFALGSSQENVEKYLAGNANGNFDFIKKISGNPFGGYMNIQMLMKSMQSNVGKDSIDVEVYNASLKFWDNVYITGGDYSDGGLSYKFEINLLDKSTNSLKQLNQYLGVVGKQMEKKKKDEIDWEKIEEMKVDTVKTIPVPKN